MNKRGIPVLILVLLLAVGALLLPGGSAVAGSEQGEVCGRPREPGEIAVLGETTPAVKQGFVRIPELDLTSEIRSGCFEFRNLILPQDPMLVSFEFRVEGYRPATWANYVILGTGYAPGFTPTLEQGNEPLLIDPCPDFLSRPEELSAAQYAQAQLCAQLAGAGTLPKAGGGGPSVGTGLRVAPALLALALVGAALLGAAASIRLMRRFG